MQELLFTINYVDADCAPDVFKLMVPTDYDIASVHTLINKLEMEFLESDEYDELDYLEKSEEMITQLCERLPGTRCYIGYPVVSATIYGV